MQANGPRTGALFGAFVHRTNRGQGQGGLRHWPYANMAAFLRDGLRLAMGMTRKNALAGLWWGGGKGLIARAPGDQADGKGAGKPHGIQQAGAVSQLSQPLSRPSQVVDLFVRGLPQAVSNLGSVGRQGLRLVQCLRTDLAHMVHAHQCARQALFLGAQRCR